MEKKNMKNMKFIALCIVICCSSFAGQLCNNLSGQLYAADKAMKKHLKALAGTDFVAKRSALSAIASGGDDGVRIPLLIAAIGDRQVGKYALKALQSRTGLKPNSRAVTNTGYPGHPITNDAGGWSAWWGKKQAEEKKKQEMKDLAQKTKEAEEKAQAALDADSATDNDKEEDGEKNIITTTKKKIPAHKKYGKLDRIIFKSGSLLICYITSKQIDLDGQLTSIDIVHRGGAGEESISAVLIASIDEDIR